MMHHAVPVLPMVCTACAALFVPVKGVTKCSLCQLALMKNLTFQPPPSIGPESLLTNPTTSITSPETNSTPAADAAFSANASASIKEAAGDAPKKKKVLKKKKK